MPYPAIRSKCSPSDNRWPSLDVLPTNCMAEVRPPSSRNTGKPIVRQPPSPVPPGLRPRGGIESRLATFVEFPAPPTSPWIKHSHRQDATRELLSSEVLAQVTHSGNIACSICKILDKLYLCVALNLAVKPSTQCPDPCFESDSKPPPTGPQMNDSVQIQHGALE